VSDDHYLTTAEAIAYLHTTQRTLYRRLANGDIPAVRIGHQWRFRTSDLDRWLQDEGRRVPGGEPRKPRVLLADDEAGVRETLTDILTLSDLEVVAVADGQAAVDAARAEAYDLLITDLRMPKLDGVQVVAEAKRLRPELKVVIITGYPSQSSAIDAINIGVDGYLTKPFRPMDVLVATARALNLGPAGSQGSLGARSTSQGDR